MAPLTALCFVLSGSALLLLSLPRPTRDAAILACAAAASLVCAIALVTMLGYVADVQVSYVFSKYARMAQLTASVFLVIAATVLTQAWTRSESTAPLRWIPLTPLIETPLGRRFHPFLTG